MSWSSGPGSPIVFCCVVCRSSAGKCRTRFKGRETRCKHKVRLTGRWKEKRCRTGVRSAAVRVEYICECGHTGWSNHMDLARRAVDEGVVPKEMQIR